MALASEQLSFSFHKAHTLSCPSLAYKLPVEHMQLLVPELVDPRRYTGNCPLRCSGHWCERKHSAFLDSAGYFTTDKAFFSNTSNKWLDSPNAALYAMEGHGTSPKGDTVSSFLL